MQWSSGQTKQNKQTKPVNSSDKTKEKSKSNQIAKAKNNNAQIVEAEKCTDVIGDDVMIDVDPTDDDDDEFQTFYGVMDSNPFDDEQLDNEELDYDSGDLGPIED